MENHCCFFLARLLCGLCRGLGAQERVPCPAVPSGALISQWLHPSPCRPQGWLPHSILCRSVGELLHAQSSVEQGGGTGMSLQMLRPGLEAKGSGFRGCSATPGQCRRPTPHFPPAPCSSAGNETCSNYSGQARKSGRSRGSGLTQLRSAVSGHAAQSPLLPLFIRPAGKKPGEVTSSGAHRGVRAAGAPGSGKDGRGDRRGSRGQQRDGAARVT